jgi:hypothetical protein
MSKLLEYKIRKSGHVVEAAYDPDQRELKVTFKNGNAYTFTGVPMQVYEGLTTADSPGKYFYNVVRLHYKGKKE